MRTDPRCPSCDGKVSSAATWCMHCGADFEAPVDANADGDGEMTVSRERETAGGATAATGRDAATTERGVDRGRASAEERDRSGQSGAELSRDSSDPVEAFASAAGSEVPWWAAPLVGLIATSEARRWGLVVAATVGVFAVLLDALPTATVPTLTSLALAGYLATRWNARETVAAAATGSGVAVIGATATTAAWSAVNGSVAAATDLLSGATPALVLAAVLVAAGRRIEP